MKKIPKPNKYRAVKVKTKEGTFDSKAEYARWVELKLLEKAGQLTSLRRQVKYPLKVGEELIGHYIADFVYLPRFAADLVIEDVKGVATELFKWKRKHVEAQYGIKITIVKMRKR